MPDSSRPSGPDANALTGFLDQNDPKLLLNHLATLFRSLSDETRLRIVLLLLTHRELNVSQLCKELNQSQPAISHHLLQLRNAGLIDSRRDGKFNFYSMNPVGLQSVFELTQPPSEKLQFSLCGLEFQIRKI